MKQKYSLFTNDVEEHSIWFNDLRDETAQKVLLEGMPILLDIYSELEIKTTFFFTGKIAEKIPEIVKMVIPYGHEVASHGYSHEVHEAFDVLSLKEQIFHLEKSKKILEEITGDKIVSFRAPALRVNEYTPIALEETGFKIDSSVASQRFDLFMSYGGLKKLKWLTAPRLPYKTDQNDLLKKGTGNIIEVPVSALFAPFTSTTMRIFPKLTSLQKHFINMESILNNKPVVFDIHPNEFIDESENVRKITRRTENYFAYILKDLIRGKLKVKNLGTNCIPLYKELIKFFNNHNYKAVTLKQYCKEVGFL